MENTPESITLFPALVEHQMLLMVVLLENKKEEERRKKPRPAIFFSYGALAIYIGG